MSEYLMTAEEDQHRRDGFLHALSGIEIGKMFYPDGRVALGGKPSVEWLMEFQVLDQREIQDLPPVEMQALFIRLARAYGRASGVMSQINLAIRSLDVIIEEREADFLKEETAKYRIGGEYWNPATKKPIQNKPPRETLIVFARQSVAKERRLREQLKREAEFFKEALDRLEFQRRCLKDATELMSLDPTAATSGF